ncbi:glycosyltransferase, partial [Vibrio cholerae]|nr:glycosyltransferase [Vibrio cholerae]
LSLILRCLTKSLAEDIIVKVIDNCSDVYYEEAFRNCNDLSRLIDENKLIVIRNEANVGMSANILKAHLIAESDWYMILSDDDRIEPDFFSKIRSNIVLADKLQIPIIKLNSQFEGECKSIEHFINLSESVSGFNSHIFLSNYIYKNRVLNSFVSCGYMHCNSYVPHFIMLLSYMLNGGKILYSKDNHVTYEVPSTGYNYARVAGLGVGCYKDLFLNLDEKLSAKIHGMFFPHNDFKVLIDLRYQTLGNNCSFDYLFHKNNYLFQVKIARSFYKMIFLSLVSRVIQSRVGFRITLMLLKMLPKYYHHIEEMERRYG